MIRTTLPANIHYVAQIEGVKEVMLYGTADLDFWIRRFAIFQWLSDSGSTPHEWRIRHAASHAKSKTYPRSIERNDR